MYLILFVGLIKLMGWIYYSTSFLKQHCVTYPVDYMERFDGKNSWALITGSSDGIGLDFTKRLAKKGFNIIQVSRNESKMIQA